MAKVVIHIWRGCVSKIEAPTGVEVELIDHDVMRKCIICGKIVDENEFEEHLKLHLSEEDIKKIEDISEFFKEIEVE